MCDGNINIRTYCTMYAVKHKRVQCILVVLTSKRLRLTLPG